MAKLVDASVIFITARIFAKVVPINVKYWKPIPIWCESSNLSLLLKNYFNKEASSSVVEQRYLRFVEMHITFLFHSKACVIGSNPILPPKKIF